jgi:hypothetical protein
VKEEVNKIEDAGPWIVIRIDCLRPLLHPVTATPDARFTDEFIAGSKVVLNRSNRQASRFGNITKANAIDAQARNQLCSSSQDPRTLSGRVTVSSRCRH